MPCIFETQGITKQFGGLTAVDHVDLRLGAGDLQCIIGPNGCGKTTLFNVITGYYRPSSGKVFFADQDITADWAFRSLLKLKNVVILNTADNPMELLEESGLNAAARLTKADGTFTFCGVTEVDHRILGEVSSDADGRRRFLEEVKALGKLG